MIGSTEEHRRSGDSGRFPTVYDDPYRSTLTASLHVSPSQVSAVELSKGGDDLVSLRLGDDFARVALLGSLGDMFDVLMAATVELGRIQTTRRECLAPVVGTWAGGGTVRVPLTGETPHVLVTVGTGGGGSTIVQTLGRQLAAQVPVTLVDATGSQPWAADVAQVDYLHEPAAIAAGLAELGEQLARRMAADAVYSCVERVVLVADADATMRRLSGDPARTLKAFLGSLLRNGRRAGLAAVIEDATGRALGPEALGHYGAVIAGRYQRSHLARIVPGLDPVPAADRSAGRVQVIRNGQAIATRAFRPTEIEEDQS